MTELGSSGAIEELFFHHYVRLVRAARVMLGDAGAAEETVQEAFVLLCRHQGRLADPGRAASYLYSTVLNLGRSRLRRLRVARRHLAELWSPERSADGTSLRADQRAVIDALRRLSRRQRECLVLRYYLDLSETEIAEAMGISAGSVKTHAARGLATLKKELDG